MSEVPKTPAHTTDNSKSPSAQNLLEQLETVLIARKQGDPNDSYVASLYHKGLNKILEKVGEEATETILAAKDLAQQAVSEASPENLENDLVGEVADLWFHSLVMLASLDIPLARVLETLNHRFGLSGHTEKAQRQR